MHRTWLFVLCFLLLPVSSLAQSSSESQGMQALVAEVRLLRKDLQASNGYALKANFSSIDYRFRRLPLRVHRSTLMTSVQNLLRRRSIGGL